MWWMMAGGAIAGWFGNQASQAQADANTRLSGVSATASNKVRAAGNAASAAESSLQRWAQSVSNNRRLDAGGKALEANLVNLRRSQDAMLSGNLSQQLQEAEQAGAAAASQAAAGVGGNVVDMVNGSTALRDAIVGEAVLQRGEAFASDAARQAASIMLTTVGGLDNSLIMDQLDYNQDFAQISPKIGSLAAAIRGAFPYKDDMIGKAGDPNANTKSSTGFRDSRQGGLSIRERGNQYDLADQASDTSFKFNMNTDSNDPYSLWGNDTKFGDKSSNDGGSMYSLWSR